MRYHLRERAWSLTEAFLVRDDAGNPVFEIRGRFFHIGDDLVIYDVYSGQELVHIKQSILSLMPRYQIYRNGQHWAEVHEQFRLFGEHFKVQGENGMVFHIDGDVWQWNFRISDAYNNVLGYVGRQLSIFRDSYAVDVIQGVDVPFIIALAVVLEMVRDHHEDKER